MNKTAIVTARLRPDLSDALDRLARRHDRSRSWLVARAVEHLVAQEVAILDLVDDAESEIEAGKGLSQHEMEAWADGLPVRHQAA